MSTHPITILFVIAEIEELKNGKVESVWVSEQLGRPVIKAFNNLLAESLANGGKETGTEDRIAMAVIWR